LFGRNNRFWENITKGTGDREDRIAAGDSVIPRVSLEFRSPEFPRAAGGDLQHGALRRLRAHAQVIGASRPETSRL
jgi:hypothetical protein